MLNHPIIARDKLLPGVNALLYGCGVSNGFGWLYFEDREIVSEFVLIGKNMVLVIAEHKRNSILKVPGSINIARVNGGLIEIELSQRNCWPAYFILSK